MGTKGVDFMQKIALITDSASDISLDIVQKYNIHVLPFRIIYSNREYRDGVDITPDEVYASLSEEVPTSSLPSMKDMEELYELIKAEGYTHVIATTVSAGLSGINNALRLVSEDYPEIKSCIFDSKSISKAEAILIEEAGRMRDQGMDFEAIVATLPSIRKKIDIYLILDTLEYLMKGGRIGRVAGTIGSMLKLKPIIRVAEDGKYSTYDKVRGRKQSLKKVIEMGKDMINRDCKVMLVHGSAKEELLKIYEELKEYSEIAQKGEIHMYGNISIVSGVHSGPGFIGIGSYERV